MGDGLRHGELAFQAGDTLYLRDPKSRAGDMTGTLDLRTQERARLPTALRGAVPLTSDGDFVYGVSRWLRDEDSEVVRWPVGGGVPRPIGWLPPAGNRNQIVVCGERLYAAEHGSLRAFPFDRSRGGAVLDGRGTITSIAADAEAVYWIEARGSGRVRAVMRLPCGANAPVELATVRFPGQVVPDGEWVYCQADTDALLRVPSSGGRAEVVLRLSPKLQGRLAVDERHLYFLGRQGIYRLEKPSP